ncbi:hypothetical protein [Arthrobacter sp. DR-2P]|nr:hypothetical protein [Arthrobacter sp. DR-2P]
MVLETAELPAMRVPALHFPPVRHFHLLPLRRAPGHHRFNRGSEDGHRI